MTDTPVDIRVADERLEQLAAGYEAEPHMGKGPERECEACRHSIDVSTALRELQALRLALTARDEQIASLRKEHQEEIRQMQRDFREELRDAVTEARSDERGNGHGF